MNENEKRKAITISIEEFAVTALGVHGLDFSAGNREVIPDLPGCF